MNYGEFMAFHRTHEPSRLYLLAGEENYFIKKAEKHLLSLLFPDGCQPEDIQLLGAGAGIPEIIGSIQSVPFFTDRNVIIVRDTDLFRERRGAADDELPGHPCHPPVRRGGRGGQLHRAARLL